MNEIKEIKRLLFILFSSQSDEKLSNKVNSSLISFQLSETDQIVDGLEHSPGAKI